MQRPICSQIPWRPCILSKNHFSCEAATFITVSMTEEETSCSMSRMKEICSCFSLYTSCWAIPPLPTVSPAGFTLSPPIIWLLSHPQVLLVSLVPHCHLQNASKAYSISRWCCPAPYLCWAGPSSTMPSTPLPFSPAWTEQRDGVALLPSPVRDTSNDSPRHRLGKI